MDGELVFPGAIHYSAPSHGGLHSHNQLSGVVLSPISTQLAPAPLVETDAFGFADDGGNGYGRWMRQETMALLEVRTNLDYKFRKATQKAALWDQVSRIMAEEHGYQRSGKKCKEKLDNLYKYYKKTKDGKAGRQDGKHYRFFKQLEALYGHQSIDTTNIADQQPPLQEDRQWIFSSLVSFSDSTESNTSSSDEECKKWKTKMSELVDVQMGRIVSVQEEWLDKMLCSVENMDGDRENKEDIWRNQEAARWDREERTWASERAWIEARDAALIKALERISSHKSGSTFMAIEECDQTLTNSLNDRLDEAQDEETPQSSNGYFSLMMADHENKRENDSMDLRIGESYTIHVADEDV